MPTNDKCIENLFVTYQFHAIDAYQNDLYYFKPGNETSLNRLNQFFKNNCEYEFKFVYRKNDDLFIKVKHKHINDFFNIEFEKGKSFIADLQLVFYANMDTHGYYPKITLSDYVENGDED